MKNRYVLLALFCLGGILTAPAAASAAVTVTAATGGSSISADSTGGSYTALTGPTIAEGANKDISGGNKTIILTAPSGFNFNTGQTVTATISLVSGSGSCFSFSSTSATPVATTITYTVSGADATNGAPVCKVVFTNIQVRPTAGTPLASGNITNAGNNTSVPSSTTNYGTLTEVVGAKNKLALTTQPSSSASPSTDFATKPVVALEDQFGNTVTTDNSSTITEAAVTSGACGGTAGSGTLSSTPSSGSAVTAGVMTYTAMQYSASETIQICFSSSGVTSALSNAVAVGTSPTVTTNSAESFTPTTATLFGSITAAGAPNPSTRGFAYSTNSALSTGVSTTTESGSFSTGSFNAAISGLSTSQTYFYRAWAHNTIGTSTGAILSFPTGNATANRKMRLFEGFKIQLIGNTLKLYQK